MKKTIVKLSIIAGLAVTVASIGTVANAKKMKKMMHPPFGSHADVAYAKDIWTAMKKAHLVGPHAMNVRPYKGNHPHGAIQQTIDARIKVRGRWARVIMKRNFGGKGISVQSVYDNPTKHLGAVTVMFKRKKGYDPADLDWMWIKYKPDGSLHKNKMGMILAGKVAKGMDVGCIACHKAAGGKDMETLTEK